MCILNCICVVTLVYIFQPDFTKPYLFIQCTLGRDVAKLISYDFVTKFCFFNDYYLEQKKDINSKIPLARSEKIVYLYEQGNQETQMIVMMIVAAQSRASGDII